MMKYMIFFVYGILLITGFSNADEGDQAKFYKMADAKLYEIADAKPYEIADAKPYEVADAKPYEVADAKLYRVDDGVFQLREGNTIDITDRFLLLALRQENECLAIMLNGQKSCIEIGARYDLNSPSSPFRLGALFKDKKRCFLDIVQIEAPKGADALVTFRLHCA